MTYELIKGDAMEFVSDLGEFDYLITDPPYPTGTSNSMTGQSVTHTRLMIDSMFQSFFMELFRKIRKSDNFRCWIFTDWRQVSFLSSCLRLEGYDKQSCIVWDKGRGTLSKNYHPCYEQILYASKVTHDAGYLGRDLIRMERPKNRIHTYQKPVDLIVEICKKFPPGRCVDPFSGSGSTLLACEQMGWDSVGIDINDIPLNDDLLRINNG